MSQICVPSRPLWYTQWFFMYHTGLSFWASQLCLCILIRAWVCLPCPYIEILPHSVFEAMYMSGPHCYYYVISWYEHGNARLVHMIRWFLIHYSGYVLLVLAVGSGSLFRVSVCFFSSPHPRKTIYDLWCPSAIRWAPALAHQGAIC